MSGGEMPSGLEYPDQILFTQLRLLYDTYRRRIIDREQAIREKKKFLAEYDKNKFKNELFKHQIEIIKATEQAICKYQKEKTIENADMIVAVFDGKSTPKDIKGEQK